MELSKYLRPEHKAIGLTLEDNKGFGILRLNGMIVAIWLSDQEKTIEWVLKQADYHLEMSKSGIELGKEK